MFNITNGRRKESVNWDYFTYDKVVNKSKCLVCKNNLRNKNPTNLKTNLSTYHKQEYAEVAKRDDANKCASAKLNSITVHKISDVAIMGLYRALL